MKNIKPIVLQFADGVEYTLEFSRETVVYAERQGFRTDDIDSMVMTRVTELFYYAFRMHHPTVKKEKTDKILFEDLGGITEAITDRLLELYNVPFESLINEEGTPKNANLTILM